MARVLGPLSLMGGGLGRAEPPDITVAALDTMVAPLSVICATLGGVASARGALGGGSGFGRLAADGTIAGAMMVASESSGAAGRSWRYGGNGVSCPPEERAVRTPP